MNSEVGFWGVRETGQRRGGCWPCLIPGTPQDIQALIAEPGVSHEHSQVWPKNPPNYYYFLFLYLQYHGLPEPSGLEWACLLLAFCSGMLLPRPRDKQRHCLAQPTAAQGRPSHGGFLCVSLGTAALRDVTVSCRSVPHPSRQRPLASELTWEPARITVGLSFACRTARFRPCHCLVPMLKTLVRSKPKKKNQQQKKDKI